MASVDELIQKIRDSDDFKEKVAVLQELAQVVTPDDREAIIFINKIASYNLYAGLAPYGKKVIQHLQQKFPDVNEQKETSNSRVEQELKNLKSTDFRERLRVLEFFESEGISEAVPHLLALIETEEHPWVISKLTKTTGLLGASHNNEQIFDVLLGYLNHEDDRIRANTIEGIGGLQTSRKLPILLDTMLKDSSERVKQMASIAISFDDTVRALELLKVMLDSDDLEMADSALEVLQRFDWLEASNMYRDYRDILYKRHQSAIFHDNNDEDLSEPLQVDGPENFSFDVVDEKSSVNDERKALDDFLAPSEEESKEEESHTEVTATDLNEKREASDGMEEASDTKQVKISKGSSDKLELPRFDNMVGIEPLVSKKDTSHKSSDLPKKDIVKSTDSKSTNQNIASKVSVQRSDPKTSRMLQDILLQIKKVEENAQRRANDVDEKLSKVGSSNAETKNYPSPYSNILRRVALGSCLALVTAFYFQFEQQLIENIYRFNEAYQIVNSGKKFPRVLVQTSKKSPITSKDSFDSYNEEASDTKIIQSNDLIQTETAINIVSNKNIKSSTGTYESTKSFASVAETLTVSTVSNEEKIAKVKEIETDSKINQSTKLEKDDKKISSVNENEYKPQPNKVANVKPPKNGTHKFTYSNGDKYIGSYKKSKRHGEGTMIFANGEIYTGTWEQDKFHGYGTLTWGNGDKYEGDFIEGLRNGFGKFIWINGEIFEGNYLRGIREGDGSMQYSNGDSYKGYWEDDNFNGLGIYTFSNGAKYEGEFQNGIRDGKGIYVYSNGNTFRGDFKNGKRSGMGTYKLQNGEIYEGNFVNDKYEGNGKYTWVNGDHYEGNWSGGRMHGNGVYTWSNGDFYNGEYKFDKMHGKGVLSRLNGRYEGQFKNGYKHGEGAYVDRNGYSYAGDWLNGKKSGYGVSSWPDGEGYSGEWQNDSEHGMGRYLWSSGHKYVGQFYKGLKQGIGTFIWSDGQVQEGLWNEDSFVGKKVKTDRLTKLEKKIVEMVEEEMSMIIEENQGSLEVEREVNQ